MCEEEINYDGGHMESRACSEGNRDVTKGQDEQILNIREFLELEY